MENQTREIVERLEAAASLLEKTLLRLEERVSAAAALSGDVERITATVEQSRREADLAERLAATERELKELIAGTTPASVRSVLRRTVPAPTSAMLAKHGLAIGDGPVDMKTLDAALTGLSLEQRIAVKSQLMRAGAIA
jgi:hypothetical protein